MPNDEETPIKIEAADETAAAIAASRSNLVKKQDPKQEEADEDDDYNVPLALANRKKKPASDSKVKREEAKSEEDVKPKKNLKVKSNVKASKVKKEEDDDVEEEMDMKKKKTQNKKEEKKVVRKVKTEVDSKGKEKKARKVYALPGQKHDPPEERDSLRIFYESLYQQVPTSEMAAFWMMEWGLLPAGEAKKVYEKKLSKANQQKLRSPAKKVVSVKKTMCASVKTVKTTTKIVTKTPKKQKSSDSETDDDFELSKIKSKKQKVSA